MTGALRRWLARPQGWPRRAARTVGLGRLARRLGLVPMLRGDDASAPVQPGVLLVGHPYGVLGVGEYLRASAAAFAAAGIPFHIRNTFDWGEHLRDTHTGFPFWDRLTTARPHPVSLFLINANEMDDARRHLGHRFFAGRYNVASWHWELSRFPEAWLPAAEGLQELWASSRFIQAALAEKAQIPVHWMPHPVEVGAPPGIARSELGLPDDTYLFLTSFDFTSYVTRKNPLGAVRAFQRAFSGTREDVALVVKMNGASERPRDAAAFLAAPEMQDPRIRVVGDVLDRRRMLGLLERCDAFVSLHRSEGFGRLLAEAMLFGKPVIATGYSGNLDFTNPDTACVVDYRLVPVGPDEYPHAAGQQWADPDLDQAASYMRRLADDHGWGASLGARGRELVTAQHGPAAVGRRYRARLEELGFL